MPSKDKFDDILKNKFDGFEAPLPKGGFGAIKNEIPKERKKRGFLVPFLAAASIFFATLSGYLLVKLHELSAENKEVISNNEAVENSSSTKQKEISFNDEVKNNTITSQQNNAQNNDNNEKLITSSNNTGNQIGNDLNQGNSSQLSIPNHTNANNSVVDAVNQNSGALIALVDPVFSNDGGITISNDISPALLRSIMLTKTENMRQLADPIEVMFIENLYEEETEKEEDNHDAKWHYGFTAASIYTSKSIEGNINDEVFITKFDETTGFQSNNLGINTGLIIARDVTKNLQLFSKVDLTNIKESNAFEVTTILENPQIITAEDNAMVLSTSQTEDVSINSSYFIGGLNAGVRYNIGQSTYVSLASGAHYLVAQKHEGSDVPTENKVNFSSSFAIGKAYNFGNGLKLNVEPELKGFYRSLQKDGLVKSTPYTLGLNFILLY